MKAHKIIEVARKQDLGSYGKVFLEKIIPEAQKFKIEAMTPEDFIIPVRYGIDLMRVNAFALPFDAVYFEIPGQTIAPTQTGDYCAVTCNSVDNQMIIGRLYHLEGESLRTLPISMIIKPGDHEDDLMFCPDPDAEQIFCQLNLTSERAGKVKKEWTRVFSKVVLGSVGLLATRGIIERVVEAPARLNKRRQAVGKPPLYTYRTVTVDPALVPGARRGSDDGTRSPPRLHWRRGHRRTLPNGHDIPVRPSLIGKGDLGAINKDYRVLTGRSPAPNNSAHPNEPFCLNSGKLLSAETEKH